MPKKKPQPGRTKELVLYEAPGGAVKLEVSLKDETVWLSHAQMATLFDRDRTVITRHVNAVFAEEELHTEANVQKMHIGFGKPTVFYSLDVIISVGYRVKSKRGTQFRIWATQVLRKHILEGYSLNTRLLRKEHVHLVALKDAVQLVARTVAQRTLAGDEAEGLLRVITEYGATLKLLEAYDTRTLPAAKGNRHGHVALSYLEARRIVDRLKKTLAAAPIFGRERGEGFQSALAAIEQSVGGNDAYPSVEEKAAHLLYFIVKNHGFVDGNKRIGAVLFVWFLDRNGLLYDSTGSPRIASSTLTALTLLVAESRPVDRDVTVRVIRALIG